MSTLDGLIDATLDMFSGYLHEAESATHLTEPVTTGALTFKVAEPSALSRGVAEVGTELVWIDTVGSDSVVIAPYGRGYRSTSADSHAAGARIVQSPTLARSTVRRYLDEAVGAVYPRLATVKTFEVAWTVPTIPYRLPVPEGDSHPVIVSAECRRTGSVETARSWRFGKVAGSGASRTVELFIPFSYGAGGSVTITYLTRPSRMATDFADTGLPESCEDVVRLGAAYRIAPFLDVTQVQAVAAEAQFNTAGRSYGAGVTLGKHLFQLYQVRLGEEERAFQSRFPARIRFQG